MTISDIIDTLNYGNIFFFMLIESTAIPFPSEVVVPPAAYRAASGELNIWLVLLSSTLGAAVGSTINYAAGYYLGRPLIYKFANSKWGKMCLLNQEKIEKSEKFFDDHGMVATITGRLIPGIRQLISIPAGLAKMSYWRFLLYTVIGAGAWNAVLAGLGYYLHTFVPKNQLDSKVSEYGEYIKLVILALVGVAILYFAIKWFIKNRAQKAK